MAVTFLEKRLNDFRKTCVCPNNKTSNTNQDNDAIDNGHTHFPEAANIFPVCKKLNESGKSKTKRWQTQRTEQRNEKLQVWNCYGQQNWKKSIETAAVIVILC